MDTVIPIYKPIVLTPLQLIKLWKQTFSEYEDIPMTYAGRLDPMAEGVMILLAGDECKKKDAWLKLDKTYEIQILFGMGSDSYDSLGLVKPAIHIPTLKQIRNTINDILHNLVGSFEQPYPPFSSKPVKGKPLWWWAKHRKLSEITIPTKRITIKNISLKTIGELNITVLRSQTVSLIKQIKGDFRQKEIIEQWDSIPFEKLPYIEIEVECSSGTYMRSLASKIGEELKTKAIASKIIRTKIGNITREKCLRIKR